MLRKIVSDIAMYNAGRRIQLEMLDSYQLQLELVYYELITMDYSMS